MDKIKKCDNPQKFDIAVKCCDVWITISVDSLSDELNFESYFLVVDRENLHHTQHKYLIQIVQDNLLQVSGKNWTKVAPASNILNLLRLQIVRDMDAYYAQSCWLHAGAIQTKSGANILILGATGSGKSTLVAQWSASGCRYIDDDIVLVDWNNGQIRSIGWVLRLKKLHHPEQWWLEHGFKLFRSKWQHPTGNHTFEWNLVPPYQVVAGSKQIDAVILLQRNQPPTGGGQVLRYLPLSDLLLALQHQMIKPVLEQQPATTAIVNTLTKCKTFLLTAASIDDLKVALASLQLCLKDV